MYKYTQNPRAVRAHTQVRTHYFYDIPHGYKVEITRWKMLLLLLLPLLVPNIVLFVCWLCVLLASFLAWLNALDVFTGYRMSKTNSNHIINMRAPNAEQNTQVLCESHFSRLLLLLALLFFFLTCLRFASRFSGISGKRSFAHSIYPAPEWSDGLALGFGAHMKCNYGSQHLANLFSTLPP